MLPPFVMYHLYTFVTNDGHTINLMFVVPHGFDHFASQLGLAWLVVQPNKCIVWFLSCLPIGLSPSIGFFIFWNGIKVWGILFGSPSFTLSFLQKALNKDVF